MKKLVLIVTLGVFLIGLAACGGGGKYAEVESVMNEMLDSVETFVAACDKAEDVDAAVAAISKFGEVWSKLKPKMDELEKKFPELKNAKDNPPEELKELMKRTEEVFPKMMGAMGKLMKYASDPKFMEAQKKFAEAMSTMK